MPVSLDDVRFAFQPIVDLGTGRAVGVEVLTRTSGGAVQALLRQAHAAGHLLETDVALATTAVWAAAGAETLLPLHLNVFASTVAAGPPFLEPIRQALQGTGRRTGEVVVDIVAPYGGAERPALTEAIGALRAAGFAIAFDSMGGGDVPLTLLVETRPDLVKIDREIIAGLPEDATSVALLEALVHVCGVVGSAVVAEGVETVEQLRALYRLGVHLAQGDLLAAPAGRPVSSITMPAVSTALPGWRRDAPAVTEVMRPAVTAPLGLTVRAARDLFADAGTTSVVLVDDHGRPVRLLDRADGPPADAEATNRAAVRFAREPRSVGRQATGFDVLDRAAAGTPHRPDRDVVVVGGDGRCVGVVSPRDVLEVVQGARAAGEASTAAGR